jgi:hypothetical protein
VVGCKVISLPVQEQRLQTEARRQDARMDDGTDSEDEDGTFMALAYDRSTAPVPDGVSVDRPGVTMEETKTDGDPTDSAILAVDNPANVHPDATDNDAAADPVAIKGVDADHIDGGDDDESVDSDDAREADFRPHGTRRSRYDYEVSWDPLVREGVEQHWWLVNVDRLDVKRIDLLEGGRISISFKSSYNEYKYTPDCYMDEYELTISGGGPQPKRTVERRTVKCKFCTAQMPPAALDAHCFIKHPAVNTAAALRESCPDLPPLDGDIMKHYVDTLELAFSRRLNGLNNT